MIIIGTAGHIDHGKSSIVKRLTNTDPDRLPEEKDRGMTIDLGFAFYPTSSGETIAFVDVPGHERFVKNMVAGAGGIDMVMLVVAADDGWMPQSEEHFQIVRLLNVRQGIIVINKIDLADNELLLLLEEEIKEKVADSFLNNAPIFPVSAETGEGFDDLKAYLEKVPKQVKAKKDIKKPRLYIDRSFVRPGIGGVVTGTLRGGELSVGQTVSIFPVGKEAKVRTLHSNNRDVETVTPGARTAASFTGVDKELLIRGGVVSRNIDIKSIRDNQHLAIAVELLPNAMVPLTDRREIQLIVGTTEVDGEIRMYNKNEIKPGEAGLIFVRPDEPMLSLIGDRCIVRLPTPMVTLGGGVVIDHLPHFPRKKHLDDYSYLNERIKPTLENVLLSEVKKQGIAKTDTLLQNADFASSAIDKKVKELWNKKTVEIFEGGIYLPDYLDTLVEKVVSKIRKFLDQKSHLRGLLYEQIIDISDFPEEKTALFLRYMLSNGTIVKQKEYYILTGTEVTLKGPVKTAYETIMEQLNEDRYHPPTLQKLASGGKFHKEAIRFILDSNQVYKCGSEFIFLFDVWDEIVAFIKEHLNEKNELTVADIKEKFDYSRKFTIPILEETDRIKLTERDGDIRVKGARFES